MFSNHRVYPLRPQRPLRLISNIDQRETAEDAEDAEDTPLLRRDGHPSSLAPFFKKTDPKANQICNQNQPPNLNSETRPAFHLDDWNDRKSNVEERHQ